MQNPSSIAVVRFDHLGDHVLGAGLLRALKERCPGAKLAMAMTSALVELYERCPFVDAMLLLPDPNEHLVRLGPRDYVANPPVLAKLLQRLAGGDTFDIVIHPRFSEDYFAAGAICKALATPGARTVGFSQSRSPIRDYSPNSFYTDLIDAPESMHTAEYASLIASAAVGTQVSAAPEIWTSSEDWARVAARWSLVSGEFIAVGVGSSSAYKVPALDVYTRLLNYLLTTPYRIVLVGTEQESAFAASIGETLSQQHRERIVSTAGQLRLAELGVLLSKARLFVGPDAGPKHMAAAARTPVVEVSYVPADYPAVSRGWHSAGVCWGPWNTPFRSIHPDATALQRARRDPSRRHRPIPGISIESLLSAVESILAETAPTTPRQSGRPV